MEDHKSWRLKDRSEGRSFDNFRAICLVWLLLMRFFSENQLVLWDFKLRLTIKMTVKAPSWNNISSQMVNFVSNLMIARFLMRNLPHNLIFYYSQITNPWNFESITTSFKPWLSDVELQDNRTINYSSNHFQHAGLFQATKNYEFSIYLFSIYENQ